MKRFFLSWICSSVVMFTLSYAWHGMVLNDFSRLNYPKSLFLIFAAFTYIIIGFVVVKVVDTKFYNHLFSGLLSQGLIKGACCGIAFFLIATVVGVSFSKGADVKNLALDAIWQAIEQGTGGAIVGLTYLYTKNKVFWENQ